MSDRGPSQSWWHTAPGLITAIAGLVTAVGGVLTILVQAGIIGPDTKTESEVPADVGPVSAAPAPRFERGNWATARAALESRLARVNIQLSTGNAADEARVRTYMSGPDEAYTLLAQGCLEALGARRLRRRGHLDMIDKWYTLDVGSERYLSQAGTVRVRELKSAIVKALNEIHGTTFRSFEEVVERR